MYSKLVLFDIDGTLIAHAGAYGTALVRYTKALKAVYGVDQQFDIAIYNGRIERAITWDMLKGSGVSRKDFLTKFPSYIDHIHQSLVELSRERPLYVTIPDALTLVDKLSKEKRIAVGVMTGNAKRVAQWKLIHTGINRCFDFGLYGDEADDRIELAGMVFEKARHHFGQDFAPADVVVIGDTLYDIRAGKAIGATTIAVTTGLHGPRTTLKKEHPDFLVDSLLDRKILTFFGLVEG